MGIIERFRTLKLPTDECIVIGSGLLDAWGLRSSDDIDLVVTPHLFEKLQTSGHYTHGTKEDEPFLEKDDCEIWMTWGKEYDFTFFKQRAL